MGRREIFSLSILIILFVVISIFVIFSTKENVLGESFISFTFDDGLLT